MEIIRDEELRSLIDYLLLNATATQVPGLYNGKSGVALTLFEASQILHDEYLEEQAVNLLQEALVTSCEDISFENGITGIGYVLLFLIKNKFIECDFDEIFKSKHLYILNAIKDSNTLLVNPSIVYYLDLFIDVFPYEKEIIQPLCQAIFDKKEKSLFLTIQKLMENDFSLNRYNCMVSFHKYLFDLVHCRFVEPNIELIGLYLEAYSKSIFISNYSISIMISTLLSSKKDSYILRLKEINDEMLSCAIRGFYIQREPLNKLIETVYLSDKFCNSDFIIKIKKAIIQNSNKDQLESYLFKNRHPINCQYSYKSGVARYVLFCIQQKYNVNIQLL